MGDATAAVPGVAAETAGGEGLVAAPVDWANALSEKRNRKLKTSTVVFIGYY